MPKQVFRKATSCIRSDRWRPQLSKRLGHRSRVRQESLGNLDLLKPLTIRSDERLIFKLEHLYGGGRNVGRTLFHTSPAPTNKSIVSFPANVLVALQKEPSAKDFEVFKKHYLKSVDTLKKQQKLVNNAKKLADSIKPPLDARLVEMEKARETNLMIRGEFLNKG